MGDNLQPLQFSQPTLPGMNIKPTDEHRWPRGFTPERQQEIRESGLRIATVRQTNWEPGPGEVPHGEMLNPGAPFTGPAGERRAQDVIARSATPAGELKGLLVQTGARLPDGTLGDYHGRPAARPESPPSITVRVGGRGTLQRPGNPAEQRAGQTLLHELGHHRSFLEGNPHFAYDTPTKIGKEEAFADDNVTERFRPDPRDVRKRPDKVVEHSSGYPWALPTKRARDAYQKNLKQPTAGARSYRQHQIDQRQQQDAEVRKSNYNASQLLFRRRDREAGDTTPDVGQHPLYRQVQEDGRIVEEDIGTIPVKGRPNRFGGQR